MLLTNNQTCDLLFWCLYMGRSARDEYLELDFAEKFCIIFKVCDRTDKGRGGVCQMLTNGDRKDGVKNH